MTRRVLAPLWGGDDRLSFRLGLWSIDRSCRARAGRGGKNERVPVPEGPRRGDRKIGGRADFFARLTSFKHDENRRLHASRAALLRGRCSRRRGDKNTSARPDAARM